MILLDTSAATAALPTRWSAAVFAGKVALLRLRRGVANARAGLPQLTRRPGLAGAEVVGECRSALWSDPRPAERGNQLGKVHNLRRAARALDGTVIPAGAVFSFWRQVGRASRARGFASGRMLQGGCMVRAVGGGLCQASDGLYEAALQAGCAIVERHAHSRTVPGSAAARGRDATVAWNYVDFRFRPDRALHLSVRLTGDELVVRLLAPAAPAVASPPAGAATDVGTANHGPAEIGVARIGNSGTWGVETGSAETGSAETGSAETGGAETGSAETGGAETGDAGIRTVGGAAADPLPRATARSCGTCNEAACFRHEHGVSATTVPRAFLVDEAWPEFVGHVRGVRRDGDALAVPLRGRPGRAAWPADGFARVVTAPFEALRRGVAMRWAADAPARRRAEAAGAAGIAGRLSRALGPDVAEVWAAQSLLPHLWRTGDLGGRRFHVLMTRPPMHVLHARLDHAHAAYPDRASLRDFRADPDLVLAEAEALAEAETVVTPHPAVAVLFPGRAVRLDWCVPAALPRPPGRAVRRVAFPGPVLARKGAYEVREAARVLDLEVVLLGNGFEGEGFWHGVRTCRPGPGAGAWLDGVAAVVQPALAEEQPRRLLAACAAGVPVVATAACGVGGAGVTVVPPLDAAALIAALRVVLARQEERLPVG